MENAQPPRGKQDAAGQLREALRQLDNLRLEAPPPAHASCSEKQRDGDIEMLHAQRAALTLVRMARANAQQQQELQQQEEEACALELTALTLQEAAEPGREVEWEEGQMDME